MEAAAVTTIAVEVVADTVTATMIAEIVETAATEVDVVTTTADHHALTATPLLVATTDTAESVVVAEVDTVVVAMIVRLADLPLRLLVMMPLLHAMLHASLHQLAITTVSHAVTTRKFHGKGRLRAHYRSSHQALRSLHQGH